jgi:myo-inositol-1(or 4)-monophosphatase
MRPTLTPHTLSEIRVGVERVVVDVPPATVGEVIATSDKDNPQTTLDLAADSYLRHMLPGVYKAPTLSEEGDHSAKGGRRWVIDPIDGSINPLAGCTGRYASSVALQIDYLSILGVVGVRRQHYPTPELDIYSAVAGQGARKNGEPFTTYSTFGPQHKEYRLAAFGSAGRHTANRTADAIGKLYGAGWDTRQNGSACVDICLTAGGTWSAFFEYGLKLWDIAAAVLIAKEAGCVVRAIPTGEPYTYDVIVARNKNVLRQMARHTGITKLRQSGNDSR